jgi:hypothetical protein
MADFNFLVILDSSLFLSIKLVPHIVLIIFILFVFLHILLSFLVIVFIVFCLIAAALRFPLEPSFVIIVLALGTFPLGFPLVLLLFQLIEAGHGRVLLINSLAPLVHLLHKVKLLRVEGRFETIVDCHFLQLLWHGHESWVRVDF